MKVAVLCFKKDIEKLRSVVEHLSSIYEVDVVIYDGNWEKLLLYDCIVAYIASGIVIRGLCPLMKSKWTDPAVVVLDKPLKHAVVLLGGHHGGNEVAGHLERLGMEAVVTTAMEYSDGVSLGIGFRKNVGDKEIIDAILKALDELDLSLDDIRVISTVEGKENSEIIKVADRLKKPLIFIKKDVLNEMDVRVTKAVMVGAKNVSEGCALYCSKFKELILPKRVYGGVTVAIAR